MRLNILSTCLLLLLSGVFADGVCACTCGEATVAENLRDAKAVFLGEVISKRKSDVVEKSGVEVTLKVHRVWKGRIAEQALVYTAATGDLYPFVNLCATPFEVGQKYLVFAYRSGGKLATDVCTGSGNFPYAERVMQQLGNGRAPLKLKTQSRQ